MKRCIIVMAAALTILQAQPPKEFEVATIKPVGAGDDRVKVTISRDGGFSAGNVTVSFLIEFAYGVKDFQVSGLPGWASSERFDVNAKMENAATAEELRLPMQALLAERFKLQMHQGSKELPIYALVAAKNGPKLKPSEGGPGNRMMRMGKGMIEMQGATLKMLAGQLERATGRTVVDKTGIEGEYQFKLEFAPDDAPAGSAAPSLFTALQESLGLKLESQKGPVPVIIVDKIDRPTEN